MDILHGLGAKFGTDKAIHTFKGVDYLDVYSGYFEPVRESVKTVFEIGVLRGASLKVWREYFPKAEIWGLDIDPEAIADYGERIHVVQGSQIDPLALAKIAPGCLFDVVIDDGSHVVDHILRTFELVWPRVKPDGFYVVEDLQVSYWDISGEVKKWPGQHHNPPDTNYKNDRAKLDRLFTTSIQSLERSDNQFRFVHFWPMQCILKRA